MNLRGVLERVPGFRDKLKGGRDFEVYTPEAARRKAERERALRAYRPDERERDIVSTVQERYRRAEAAKQGFYGIWALSLAFFKGDQYSYWAPLTRELLRVSDEEIPPWRERVVDNQVTKLATTAAAKWARAKHVTMALPNDPQNPQDIAAAQIGTKVLRHLDRVTNRNENRRQLEIQRAIYGSSFISPYWDSQKYAEVAWEDPQTGSLMAFERQVGDMECELLNVWEVAPQPVQYWKHVRWCVKAKVRSLEWMEEAFGDRGLLVEQEAVNEIWGEKQSVSSSFRNLLNASGADGRGEEKEPSARLLEYYELPCRSYPNGRYYIVGNGVLLWEADELPNPKRKLPCIPYIYQYVPGQLWGRGVVEDLIGQQQLLNKNESRIQENINQTSRPKYAVPREAALEEDALDDAPGEVIEYTSRGGIPAPQAMDPPSMPGYASQLPELIKERMEGIAGLHQASTGQFPDGVKSGIAIDLMQKADDTRQALPTEDAADAWQKVDQLLLECVQVYYTVPRVVTVVGKKIEEVEVLSFLGADLNGNAKVTLEASDGLSDDLATKRQRVIDYCQSQMLPTQDPEFMAGLFRYMDEMDISELLREFGERNAQQQEQMAQAQQGEAQAMQQAQQAEMEMEMQKHQMDLQAKQADLEFKQQEMQMQGAASAQKLQIEQILGEMKLKQAETQMVMDARAGAGKLQMQQQTNRMTLDAKKEQGRMAIAQQVAKARAAAKARPATSAKR